MVDSPPAIVLPDQFNATTAFWSATLLRGAAQRRLFIMKGSLIPMPRWRSLPIVLATGCSIWALTWSSAWPCYCSTRHSLPRPSSGHQNRGRAYPAEYAAATPRLPVYAQ